MFVFIVLLHKDIDTKDSHIYDVLTKNVEKVTKV